VKKGKIKSKKFLKKIKEYKEWEKQIPLSKERTKLDERFSVDCRPNDMEFFLMDFGSARSSEAIYIPFETAERFYEYLGKFFGEEK
jgi:hypothetical protein